MLNSFATKLSEPNSIILFGDSTVTWCMHWMHTAQSGYTLVRESLDLTHLTPLSWVIDTYRGINLTRNCVPQHEVFSSAVKDFLLVPELGLYYLLRCELINTQQQVSTSSIPSWKQKQAWRHYKGS